jgi:hypothetical protein
MHCIKVRKNFRTRWKKGTSLEIYQLYPKKKYCKNGSTVLDIEKD